MERNNAPYNAPGRAGFLPGNPGRPKGARHRVTKTVEGLLSKDAERLTRRAIELAMDGDPTALRLCLERIAPARKDAPLPAEAVDLPPLRSAADIPLAMARIVEAVGEGRLTPSEGQALAGLLEAHRRATETADLEKRIEALENPPGLTLQAHRS